MKKVFFLMALSICAAKGNAQIKEGRTMLGANLNYSNRLVQQLDTTNAQPKQLNKNNTFYTHINYGHMISDHVMLGFGVGFQNVTANADTKYANGNSNLQKSITKSYSAGLFARYYQRIAESKFYVFGEGFTNFSLGAGDYKSTYTSVGASPTDYKNTTLNTTFSAGITPGIAYFINKLIALEASMGSISFSNTTSKLFNGKKQTQKKTDATFNSDLDLRFSSLLISVTFYFGG